ETLPSTANFRQPSSNVKLQDSPFRILRESEPWPARLPNQPRRAAVSAFGFGGINAHLLVEEWLPAQAITIVNFPAVFEKTKPSRPDVAIVGMAAHVGPWESLPKLTDQFRPQNTDHHFISELNIPLQQFRIPPKEMEE